MTSTFLGERKYHAIQKQTASDRLTSFFTFLYYSGCDDAAIRVWSVEQGTEVGCMSASSTDAKDLPLCLKWAPNAALFATGSHFVKLWVPK